MTVQGLTEAQLPELKLPDSNSFRLYPDKINNETFAKEDYVVGRKQQKIAFVPTRAGKATIPEITINWWDTQKNRARVVRIPARTITILPAIAGSGVADSASIAGNTIVLGESGMDKTISEDAADILTKSRNLFDLPVKGTIWVWLALFFLVMWIATAVAWIYHHRRLKSQSQNTTDDNTYASAKQALYAVRQASMKDKPKQTRDAVIAWARLVWPDKTISNVGDILNLLNDDQASQALADLDSLLYSGKPQQWMGKQFWDTFLSVETAQQLDKPSPGKLIKDLYPA